MAKNIEIQINQGNNSYEILYPTIDLTNTNANSLPLSKTSGNLEWNRLNKKWVTYYGVRNGDNTIIQSFSINYPNIIPYCIIYGSSTYFNEIFTYTIGVPYNGSRNTGWKQVAEKIVFYNYNMRTSGSGTLDNYTAYGKDSYPSNVYPQLRIKVSFTTTQATFTFNAALGQWSDLSPYLYGLDIGNDRGTYYYCIIGYENS